MSHHTGPRGPYKKYRYDLERCTPIKQLRVQSGFTLAQASKIFGRSRQTLASWEKNWDIPVPNWIAQAYAQAADEMSKGSS